MAQKGKRKNFFDGIENQVQLKNGLIHYAGTHDLFSFYCSKTVVESTDKNGLRVSYNANWNDKEDRENVKKDGKIRFIKCFTYSRTENIAMWMLYGDYRISIRRGVLNKYLETIKKSVLDIYEFENDCPSNAKRITSVGPEDFTVELIDVVYYEIEEKGVSMKKSTYGKQYDINILENLEYYMKKYGWAYENECRLVITLNNPPQNLDKNKTYYINLSKPERMSLMSTPRDSDEGSAIEGYEIEYSKYKGKIDWNPISEKPEEFIRAIRKMDDDAKDKIHKYLAGEMGK